MKEYTPEDFFQDKQALERAKQEENKSEARLDLLLNRLEQEFGCTSVKQAKKLLTKKEQERDSLDKQIKLKKVKFDRKWAGE